MISKIIQKKKINELIREHKSDEIFFLITHGKKSEFDIEHLKFNLSRGD